MKERLKKLMPDNWWEWVLVPIFTILAFWPLWAASTMRNPSPTLEWYLILFFRDFYNLILVVSFIITLSTGAIIKDLNRMVGQEEKTQHLEKNKSISLLISIFDLLPWYIIWCSWLFLGEAILEFIRIRR